MTLLEYFKKKNGYSVKNIADLPQKYKDIIYFLRPPHTSLSQQDFVGLYTSVLIDNTLYLKDISKADNYLKEKDVKKGMMIEFVYSTDKGVVLKNRFGDYNKYPDVRNCNNYKIKRNTFCCIQWTGKNLQEVFDFCGGSWYFINKFFDGDWGKYADYVKTHNYIFKVWYSDNYHRCAYPGDYLVRFVDGNILIVSESVFEDNFKKM